MISSAVNTTVRGNYIYCNTYGKLKEEIIRKYFVRYSIQEGFNIKDMYEEISDETDKIFREAYESGMFKLAEDEATFRILRMFDDIDPLIIPHPKYASATFKGDHIKNCVQEIEQPNNPSCDENCLGIRYYDSTTMTIRNTNGKDEEDILGK
ncbi:MAG: hypothetical protein ACLRFL_01175 [Clostridia bacterium]